MPDIVGTPFDDELVGTPENDLIEGLEGEDEIEGGDGDDRLEGGADDDSLFGNRGDDILDGGDGDDEASYDIDDPEDGATQGISADLTAGTVVDGYGDTDTLISIEIIEGGALDDFITAEGSTINVTLMGRDGDDTIIGGDGEDEIIGDAGNDVLRGGDGSDFIMGLSGDDEMYGDGAGDFFRPGSGNDTIYGGRGGANDWRNQISYARDDQEEDDLNDGPAGIAVTFTNEEDGTIIDWDGDTDTFYEIDAVQGTMYDDTFIGAEGQQVFVTLDGVDFADGGAGDNDMIDFRPLRWLSDDNTGVDIDLAAGTAEDGFGNTDTILNFEEARGTDLSDVIRGTDGDNWIEDGSYIDEDETDDDDVIEARGGNDRIQVGWGNDTVDGGEGDEDVLRVSGDFEDWTFTSTGANSFTLESQYGTKTVSNVEFIEFRDEDMDWVSVESLEAGATNGDDVLGDPNSDARQNINGLGGNDTITGGSGEDWLQGGDGNDTITGGAGGDNLDGGRGNDIINADDGDGNWDWVQPGEGNDTINGDGSMNLAYRNLDFAVEVDMAAGTTVDRETGGDIKTDSFTGIRSVVGTDFDDVLLGGNPENDDFEQFRGEGGDDILDGGSGYDKVEYYWEDGNGPISVDLANETATDTYGDTDTLRGIEAIDATNEDDVLIGTVGFQGFVGNAGDDIIDGGSGDFDRARYDRDRDRGGNNGIIANLSTGVIIDGFGDEDTVTNIEWVRGTDFDDVMMTSDDINTIFQGGDGDDHLMGAGGNDELFGGEGSDILEGHGGNDILWHDGGETDADGGDGYDTLRVQDDRDAFEFTAHGDGEYQLDDATFRNIEAVQFDDGRLTIAELESGATNGDDEVMLFTPGSVSTAGGDDMVTGSDGDDVIMTGTGNDTVNAGAGDDWIVDAFGDGDELDGGDGADTIVSFGGGASSDGGAGDDLMIGGIGNDEMEGGAGNDMLRGDVLGVIGGNDRIDGGTGDDLLMGGIGVDTFIFSTGDGSDTIARFASVEDGPATLDGPDFTVGLDVIALEGFGYADASDALANVTNDTDGNAVFADQGTTITLLGVDAATLTVDEFVLA